jgi:predicted Zn-dependent protease
MSLIRILIIATLVMFAAVAFALRSGPEERIAMLVRDGRKAEAATEIKHMLATGLAKPRLLMTLAQLEEALGDQTQASATMDVYVLARPHDRDALAWLVKTYEASDESAGLAEALTKLTALEPTPRRPASLRRSFRGGVCGA